ncbi:MAG: DsbA family protein [Solirubrobacteraceae bacterium]
MKVEVTLFTDPACPFAFSAEPVRQRLRWHYGEGLDWHLRMIVLTLEPGEADRLAEGAPGLQRRYGMPIAPEPYPRAFSSEPACRAIVAARRHAPAHAARLLRALRVRTMAGGLLDDPQLIAAAARDAALDLPELARWSAEPAVAAELESDIEAARSPSASARALDHKLSGPADERRYAAPSYELRRTDGLRAASIPGFNPIEAYEAAIASVSPELPRAPKPESVSALLAWADEPLATAEVIAVMQRPEAEVRTELGRTAVPTPAGAEFYWSLPA